MATRGIPLFFISSLLLMTVVQIGGNVDEEIPLPDSCEIAVSHDTGSLDGCRQRLSEASLFCSGYHEGVGDIETSREDRSNGDVIWKVGSTKGKHFYCSFRGGLSELEGKVLSHVQCGAKVGCTRPQTIDLEVSLIKTADFRAWVRRQLEIQLTSLVGSEVEVNHDWEPIAASMIGSSDPYARTKPGLVAKCQVSTVGAHHLELIKQAIGSRAMVPEGQIKSCRLGKCSPPLQCIILKGNQFCSPLPT